MSAGWAAGWVAGLGGAAVALGLHALWALLAEARRRHEAIPYRAEPPLLFRRLWSLILLMAPLAEVALTPNWAARIERRLRQAGLDLALTPPQLLSGQLVHALLGALVGGVLIAAIGGATVGGVLLGAAVGFSHPSRWLSRHIHWRERQILKALPFFIDLVTLAVEAGLSLAGALDKAVEKAPPGPLCSEMHRVLRDIRAGRDRTEALRELARRLGFPPVSSLVSALVQGERTGASLGVLLRAQSAQRRSERFLQAEKQAMEAPVKMLVPLVLFIFPCTFIVIGFPIAVRLLSTGL